jgi:hypothetical protein
VRIRPWNEREGCMWGAESDKGITGCNEAVKAV